MSFSHLDEEKLKVLLDEIIELTKGKFKVSLEPVDKRKPGRRKLTESEKLVSQVKSQERKEKYFKSYYEKNKEKIRDRALNRYYALKAS